MRCAFCGHINLTGVQVCRKCASRVEVLCPECGFMGNNDDPYCESCGACVGLSA